MALSLQQIIGTITGKLAFERTQANFQAVQAAVNTNETNITDKLGAAHNTDAAAHADIRESINDLGDEVVAHKAENATRNNLGHVKAPEGWKNATLENGWQGNIRYRKDFFNTVHIEIQAYGGIVVSKTTITTLPEGYRPTRDVPVDLRGSDAEGVDQSKWYLSIKSDGKIKVGKYSGIVAGYSADGYTTYFSQGS